MKAYYFGCIGVPGHYLHREPGIALNGRDETREAEGSLPFAPWTRIDGEFYPHDRPNGEARLTHNGGWTILGFSDNTVDHRGGSHSTFLFDEHLDGDAAIAEAQARFPNVWRRYPFTVTIVETVGMAKER